MSCLVYLWYYCDVIVMLHTLKVCIRDKNLLSGPPCLQEMSLMLVCLRKYEFEENHCLKEIDAFMQCSRKHEVINY